MDIHQPAGDHADVWIGLNDRASECGKDGRCFLRQDGSELVWTAWADGEPNDWQESDHTRDHAPGPTEAGAQGNPGEDCVMAFACSHALNRGCNAPTEHLHDSNDAQAVKEDRDEINDYRRFAIAMLAVGSLGCGLAAMLACVASVASGQALLNDQQAKASRSPMRR